MASSSSASGFMRISVGRASRSGTRFVAAAVRGGGGQQLSGNVQIAEERLDELARVSEACSAEGDEYCGALLPRQGRKPAAQLPPAESAESQRRQQGNGERRPDSQGNKPDA